MPTVPSYDLAAQSAEGGSASDRAAGQVELSDEVFGLPPNEAVLHQAVLAFLAAQRRGTASTRTRAEVRGSTRKLHRQKGLGRARAGSRRSPTRVGGGVAHGPRPRSYGQRLPRKMRRLALRSALSAKLAGGELTLLEDLKLDEISTRRLAQVLEALDKPRPLLLAVAQPDEKLLLSARNLPGVKVIAARDLNPYRVLACRSLLLTRQGAAALEAIAR
jgi:large subunit ribosomal protein L4